MGIKHNLGLIRGAKQKSLDKIGRHHFAFLRALYEGVPLKIAANQYFVIEHMHEAEGLRTAITRQLISRAAKLGLRRGVLMGVFLEVNPEKPPSPNRPTFNDFITLKGLEDWSVEEAYEIYISEYPENTRIKLASKRVNVRKAQLELLRKLEDIEGVQAGMLDQVEAWFNPPLARRLKKAGIFCLYDLHTKIATGGKWWSAIDSFGPEKASRVVEFLNSILPERLALIGNQNQAFSTPAAAAPSPALPSARGDHEVSAPNAPTFNEDLAAINSWIMATAGSTHTARYYRKDGMRLLLWGKLKAGKTFKEFDAPTCLAFMTFLGNVPADWINRGFSKTFERSDQWSPSPNWRPFKGQLSSASRQQSIIVCSSMFDWFVKAGYLDRNPWHLVNKKIGDDATENLFDSRAFSPSAWEAILQHIEASPPSPSLSRIKFILKFGEATGVRASELLGATTSNIRRHKQSWVMQVHGKGSRNRIIALPSQAVEALDEYLQSRGLTMSECIGEPHPLLSSTIQSNGKTLDRPLSYPTIYKALKRFLDSASQADGLEKQDKTDIAKGSPHWLRHTFGTRALERNAPIDVIQRQLGHADPRTTMRYSKAQIDRLTESLEGAFGGGNQ